MVFHPYPWSWEMVVLLLLAGLAVAVNNFELSALGLWRAYFLEPILFYLVAFNVLGRDGGVKKIIFALSLSAVWVSAVAWYQHFFDLSFLNPVWSQSGRATSVFEYANAVGLYLAPIVLLAAGHWFYSYHYRRASNWRTAELFFYAAVVFLSLGAIIFAKSDGALFGLAVAVLIFGLLAGRKSAAVTITAAVLVVLVVYFQPPLKQELVKQATFKNLSGEIRRLQWRETWLMLKQDKHWFIGAGLAGYGRAVAPFHQEGLFFNRDNDPDFKAKTIISAEYREKYWQPVEIYLYPHNIFLNFWSELGLLGALLFVWIFVKFFYIGIQNLLASWKFKIKNFRIQADRYLILGLLCAMLAIVIHGLVDVPYLKNDLAVLFWLLLLMMGLVGLNNKK